MKHSNSGHVVLAAVTGGIVAGCLCRQRLNPGQAEAVTADLAVIRTTFLPMIEIIAPLVFTGIAAAVIARWEGAPGPAAAARQPLRDRA